MLKCHQFEAEKTKTPHFTYILVTEPFGGLHCHSKMG